MIKTRKQFIATLLALGTLTAGASMAWDGKRSGAETRLKARLTGPAIAALKPSGEAEFRSSVGRSRLSVEVEDVNGRHPTDGWVSTGYGCAGDDRHDHAWSTALANRRARTEYSGRPDGSRASGRGCYHRPQRYVGYSERHVVVIGPHTRRLPRGPGDRIS